MSFLFLVVGLVLGCGLGGLVGWAMCARATADVIPDLEDRARNAQRARIHAEEQLADQRAQSTASFARLRSELAARPAPVMAPGPRHRLVEQFGVEAEVFLRERGFTSN